MSARVNNDAEVLTKVSDKTSNKKAKVEDIRGGSNIRSWIWLYFDSVSINNEKYAVCKVETVKGKKCGEKYKNSTSNCSRHLSNVHGITENQLEKYIRVLEVELAKDANLDKDSKYLTKIMLTKDEWDLLRNLIPVLGLFEEATRYLGGSKYVTYSTMNPIMIHIIDMLKLVSISPEEINVENIKDIFAELEICVDNNDTHKKINLDKPMQTSGVLEKVKETLYRAMRFYWKKDNIESYLPSILDPRVKKFDFASDKIKQVQDLLRARYQDAKDRSTTSTPTTNTLSPASYFHNATVSSFYKPTLLNIFNNPSPLNLQSELDEYLAVPQIPFDSDPFMWWNVNKDRFPVISRLARTYLAVSATSTPSERLFSDGGNMMGPKRTRMNPEFFKRLMFLKRNHNFLDSIHP
ncbi:1743_t:CDS:2 [Racocetra fulgida]|uniref:1743_t:CDS:1 n=1 Tax=Racocetra fulgida TaxID=60492 RepID=A0A9N8Z6R6_9GLOM|nr:1743_t:CDS:2 [Racocetra fulgida]